MSYIESQLKVLIPTLHFKIKVINSGVHNSSSTKWIDVDYDTMVKIKEALMEMEEKHDRS